MCVKIFGVPNVEAQNQAHPERNFPKKSFEGTVERGLLQLIFTRQKELEAASFPLLARLRLKALSRQIGNLCQQLSVGNLEGAHLLIVQEEHRYLELLKNASRPDKTKDLFHSQIYEELMGKYALYYGYIRCLIQEKILHTPEFAERKDRTTIEADFIIADSFATSANFDAFEEFKLLPEIQQFAIINRLQKQIAYLSEKSPDDTVDLGIRA